MDFLMQMVNDGRFHEDEVLLLALLQALDVKTVTLSLGEVPIATAVEALRERVEKNISKRLQDAAEREANKALGKPPSFSEMFGL